MKYIVQLKNDLEAIYIYFYKRADIFIKAEIRNSVKWKWKQKLQRMFGDF